MDYKCTRALGQYSGYFYNGNSRCIASNTDNRIRTLLEHTTQCTQKASQQLLRGFFSGLLVVNSFLNESLVLIIRDAFVNCLFSKFLHVGS